VCGPDTAVRGRHPPGPGRAQVVATTGRRLQKHERARCARLVMVGGRDTQAHPELWGPLPQPVDGKWLRDVIRHWRIPVQSSQGPRDEQVV
jgi:hypothetical protein